MPEANVMIHPIDIDVDINIEKRSPLWRKFAHWWRTWRNGDCCIADKVDSAAPDSGANGSTAPVLAGKWPGNVYLLDACLSSRKTEQLGLGAIDSVLAELRCMRN